MAVASLINLNVLQTAVNSLKSITSWTTENEDLANSSLRVFNAILVESDAYKSAFVNSGALQQISRLMLLPVSYMTPPLIAPESFIISCCGIMSVFNQFSSTSSQTQILLSTDLSSYRKFQFCFIYALQSILFLNGAPVAAAPSKLLVEALITSLGVAPFGANPIGAAGIFYYSSYRVDKLAIQANVFFNSSLVGNNSEPIALGVLNILQFFAQVAMVADMADTSPYGPAGAYPLPGPALTANDFKSQPIAEPMISQIVYIMNEFVLDNTNVACKSLSNFLVQSTYFTWPTLLNTRADILAAVNHQFTDDANKTEFITPGLLPSLGPVAQSIQEASELLRILASNVNPSDPIVLADAYESCQLGNYFLGLVSANLVNIDVSTYTSKIQNIPVLQRTLSSIVERVCNSWTPYVPIILADFIAPATNTFFDNDILSAFTVGSRSVDMLSPIASLGVYMSGGLNMQANPTIPREGSGMHHLFVYQNSVVNTVFAFVILAQPNSFIGGAIDLAIPDPAYPSSYTGPPTSAYSVPYNVTVPIVFPTGPYTVPEVPYVGSVWFYATAYVGLNTMSIVSDDACNAAACICQLIRHFCLPDVNDTFHYYKKWFLYWNAIPLISKLLQTTNVQLLIQAQETLAQLALPMT